MNRGEQADAAHERDKGEAAQPGDADGAVRRHYRGKRLHPGGAGGKSPMTVVYALDSANLTFRDSDAANIDQINYAFALIRDGEAVGSHWAAIDRVRAYLRKHPHIRGVMAVGGWGAEGFSDACATADGRARLADSILCLMDENGFRGVDIDWEYPGTSAGASRAARRMSKTGTRC